jgi:alkaline phosphatase
VTTRASAVALLAAIATTIAAGSAPAIADESLVDAKNRSLTDAGRWAWRERFPTGNVIFFHPDGTGANHWHAARLYFKGLDGSLNWDRLAHISAYRGHMGNVITGTSNGGATTHAFGYKVDGLGSFGKDGDGNLGTDNFINALSGYPGSLMREAANAGMPVGVVNDGHIGEPGTGAFLAEVGNRNNWQEITRQMIQGRPGMNDTTPWVIMGGGEADTRPAGTTLLHRNANAERGQPTNSQVSLRTDNLDLELDWNDNGSGDLSNDPLKGDDYIVIKTRAQFQRLRTALGTNPRYAPRVLGLFSYQDLFNDRNEEDLIARGFVRSDVPINESGPAPRKQSRLVLFGDPDATQPGFNPPTFTEMTEVAIQILDRAVRQIRRNGRNTAFFLVAEQEANDNFGNSDNAVGMLQAMRETDEAIGAALRYVDRSPRTLVLTAADSDAGGMQVVSPNIVGVSPPTNVLPIGRLPDHAGTVSTNPAGSLPTLTNALDGVEGRASRLFVTEADQYGQRQQFGILWPGSGDYAGGILSRAAGLNGGLLSDVFSERFDNIDVYRMMHATLFGRLLEYPQGQRAPER